MYYAYGMANAPHKIDIAAHLHRSGRLNEAEQMYKEILAHDKRNSVALSLLGTLYIQTGQAERALPYLQKANSINPRNAEFINNLGAAYHHMGKTDDAITRYGQAVRMNPHYPEALNNLGAVLLQSGRSAEGIPHLESALRLNPNYLQAHTNLAKAYRATGRSAEAIPHYEAALKINPRDVDTLFHLCTLLREQEEFDRAITHYTAAIHIMPHDHRLKNNLGNMLRESGKPQEALPLYASALDADPYYVDAHINQGVALQDLGDLAAAGECYARALSLNPASADTHVNIGSLHLRQNNLETARTHYQHALDLQPESINAQWNMALVQLALGDYAQGWAHYECGFGFSDKRGKPPFTNAKKWNGEPLSGKRLLIWGEQGLGDQLQFVRYASTCKGLGAEVSVLCAAPLVTILATHPAVSRVLDHATEQDFDYHIAMMSLPHHFGTVVDTIPSTTPYLFVTPDYRTKWAERFTKSDKLKVGLVWAGNAREGIYHANMTDRRRSISLAMMQPLLDIDGIEFYNLQMGEPAAQIDELNLRDRLIDPMGEVQDFMDTAAIIEHLDLVISVDTSVVHLTGALGKPMWVLSRRDACWRWLNNRPDSPWYPSARIFGQPTAGDWESVIQNVSDALVERAINYA